MSVGIHRLVHAPRALRHLVHVVDAERIAPGLDEGLARAREDSEAGEAPSESLYSTAS